MGKNKPRRVKKTFAVDPKKGIFELNVPIDITDDKYKNYPVKILKPTLHSTGDMIVPKKKPKQNLSNLPRGLQIDTTTSQYGKAVPEGTPEFEYGKGGDYIKDLID